MFRIFLHLNFSLAQHLNRFFKLSSIVSEHSQIPFFLTAFLCSRKGPGKTLDYACWWCLLRFAGNKSMWEWRTHIFSVILHHIIPEASGISLTNCLQKDTLKLLGKLSAVNLSASHAVFSVPSSSALSEFLSFISSFILGLKIIPSFTSALLMHENFC